MSSVSVTGNITRDPELRFTQNGRPSLRFGIAENRRWTDGDGQAQESVGFYDVQVWGLLAENAASSLRKGDRVVVVGRLDHHSWEQDDGTKRSKVEVVATDLGPSLMFATAEPQKVERAEPAPAGKK